MVGMKFTDYFQAMRQRPDRVGIRLEWIEQLKPRNTRKTRMSKVFLAGLISFADFSFRVVRVVRGSSQLRFPGLIILKRK